MEITSLIGPSGTGKSYRALIVAKERDIDYVIDDGLFIKGNKVIAGVSAKREPTKISAVKRAMFMDPYHRKTVSEAIKKHNPDKILILGTSDRMVDKIVKALNLPPVKYRLYIKDIATEEEIDTARKYRYHEGKHVIPVPTFEIKKDFSGYFVDTLKIFKIWGKNQKEHLAEKTVVRPTYSYLGRYTISNGVISSLVAYGVGKVPGVYKVGSISITSVTGGMVIDIDITAKYGKPLHQIAREVQRRVKEEVEYMTSINVLGINVTVKGLVVR